MRSYIESYQFYYVPEDVDFTDISRANDMAFKHINSTLDRIKISSESSISFLRDSVDTIESEVDRWYQSYLLKIENIANTNKFIADNNLTTEDNSYFAMFEIDTSLSKNISFSKVDNGFELSPLTETFVGD